jgi:hypothetical protein
MAVEYIRMLTTGITHFAVLEVSLQQLLLQQISLFLQVEVVLHQITLVVVEQVVQLRLHLNHFLEHTQSPLALVEPITAVAITQHFKD